MTASSALMPIAHIFLCYILFSSFNKQPFGLGARLVEKNQSKAPPNPCSGPAKGLGVVHKYGPCSPFGHKKSAATSSQILVQDERRVRVINSRSYNRRTVTTSGEGQGEGVTDIDLLNDSVGSGNYLVNVGFGTPAQYFNLILDTGSYVTWVQCQGCSGSPCYDPSNSSTSSDAPCSPLCVYKQRYLDTSFSEGIFMVDTLSIENEYKIPEFVFLCAKGNGEFDKADGILGLGLAGEQFGDYSLTSQTGNTFGNVFCHCLPSLDNSMGYVYFGEKAQEKCPFTGAYTPLLGDSTNPNGLYFVNLNAITIGQKSVEIPSGASPKGTFIDSGTVITRLPESIYSELSSEFQGLMAEFPQAPPDKVLDTCYNLTGYNNPNIPTMILHFDNLDVNLGPTEVAMEVNDKSQVCFAFAKSKDVDDFTIIGNHQQQSRNILYNIPDQRVEIGPPGHC